MVDERPSRAGCSSAPAPSRAAACCSVSAGGGPRLRAAGGRVPAEWLRPARRRWHRHDLVQEPRHGPGRENGVADDPRRGDGRRLVARRALDAELSRAKFGGQGSGGSDSIRAEWDLYRNAGAAAREMLAGAAADAWGVPRDACRTERGAVMHAASNRRLSYGELAARAAARPVPEKAAVEARVGLHPDGHASRRRGQRRPSSRASRCTASTRACPE